MIYFTFNCLKNLTFTTLKLILNFGHYTLNKKIVITTIALVLVQKSQISQLESTSLHTKEFSLINLFLF